MAQSATTVEGRILAMLTGSREMYGLEMVKASAGTVKKGTVYVLLDRLQEKGFITSHVNRGNCGRRQYRISDRGEQALLALRVRQDQSVSVDASAILACR